MVSIRRATPGDLLGIQSCIEQCLSGEDGEQMLTLKRIATWPPIFQVAENDRGKIVGCVGGEIFASTPADPCYGLITAFAVLRPYRRQGIANQLMITAMYAMKTAFAAEHALIYLTRDHQAAINLCYRRLRYIFKGQMRNEGKEFLVMQRTLLSQKRSSPSTVIGGSTPSNP